MKEPGTAGPRPITSINLEDLRHAAAVIEYLHHNSPESEDLLYFHHWMEHFVALVEVHESLEGNSQARLFGGLYDGDRGKA